MADVSFTFAADTSRIMKSLGQMQSSIRSVGKMKWTDLSTGTMALGGVFAAVGAAAAGALVSVKSFAEGLLSAAATVETYSARFATLLGSEEAAQSHFAKLRKYAAETPFELAGISKASTALLAFGVKAEESMDILRMLGDIAAGSGGSLEELAQIYGKANTIGKLDTADFNQLGNRGLDVRSAIGARDGISAAQVQKNIAAGEYSVKDLLYALKQATSEGGLFFGATEKSSKTLAGQWSTLTDNIEEFKASLGEVLVPEAKRLLELGVNLVNKWGAPMVQGFIVAEQTVRSIWKEAKEIGSALAKWVPHFALFGKVHNALTEGIRGSWREYEDMAAALAERQEWLAEPIFKTSVELAHERELAHQAQLRAMAEQEVAEFAEKAAKRAEEEKKTRADMRKNLATERSRRADERDRELFSSQGSEGQRAELAYRFEQATGQKWGGGFGEDEVALARAEDAAAKKADTAAMGELQKLRDFQQIFKQTQQQEIDARNKAYELERRTRLEAGEELQRARMTLEGDEAGLRRMDAAKAAAELSQKYQQGGMGKEEADATAAEIVATQNAAAQRAVQQSPELITQSRVAVGGGGRSLRLGDAQLDVAKQGVAIMKEQKSILDDLRNLFRNAGSAGIPVTA